MPSHRALQTVPSAAPGSSEPTGRPTTRPGQHRPLSALGASTGTRFHLAAASWSVCAQTHQNPCILTVFPFPRRSGRLAGETSVPSRKQGHGPGVSRSCLKRCGLANGPEPGTRRASVLFRSSPEWRCGDVSSGRSPSFSLCCAGAWPQDWGLRTRTGSFAGLRGSLQRGWGGREAQVGAGLGPRRPGLSLSPAPPRAPWQHAPRGHDKRQTQKLQTPSA